MKFAISLVVVLSVLAVPTGGITASDRFIEWGPDATEQGAPLVVPPLPILPGSLSLPDPGTPFSLPIRHILLSEMRLMDLIPCTLEYGYPREWEEAETGEEEDGVPPVWHTLVILADGVFFIPEFMGSAIGDSLSGAPFFDIPEINPPGTEDFGIDWKLNF